MTILLGNENWNENTRIDRIYSVLCAFMCEKCLCKYFIFGLEVGGSNGIKLKKNMDAKKIKFVTLLLVVGFLSDMSDFRKRHYENSIVNSRIKFTERNKTAYWS